MQRPCSKAIRFQYIAGVVVLMALTGCASWGWGATPPPTLDPSLIDSSILTGIPCAAPCWYGLEVDRSTKADILATARTLSFVDSKEFPEELSSYFDPSKQAEVGASLIRLNCRQPEGGTCASLLVVNDVLKEIYLLPLPSLSFGQVVPHLGPPEYVRVFPVEGNPALCDIALIWKQRGIWVAFSNGAFLNGSPQKEQVRCQAVHSSKDLSPNLPVDQIIYGSPDDYIFATASESGGDLPWSGFAQP
jgi:hypothetical protein